MGNSYGCMAGMHLLMNDPEIEYKAAHFIGPFLGFHPSKKSTYAKLYPVARTTCFVRPGAALPATVHKASNFENLEDGSFLPRAEHQVPWLLDIDNPCRHSGVPFRSFISFSDGVHKHSQFLADGG